MRAICFYWDDGEILNRDIVCQRRLMKQWTHTAKAFGVHTLLCIVQNHMPELVFDVEVNFVCYTTLAQVRAAYPDHTFVVLTENGQPADVPNIPMEDVIYVTGSNYSEPATEEGDILVAYQSDIPLWDIVAMSLLLEEVYSWHLR